MRINKTHELTKMIRTLEKESTKPDKHIRVEQSFMFLHAFTEKEKEIDDQINELEIKLDKLMGAAVKVIKSLFNDEEAEE